MIIGADFYPLRKSPADSRRRSIGNERSDLGILGSCGSRALRIHEFKNPRIPWIPRDSRILGFLDVFFSFFFLFWTVGSQNPRMPGPRVPEILWTRADPRIPRRWPRESGCWIKRAWPIESDVDQTEDPRILSAFAKRPLGSARWFRFEFRVDFYPVVWYPEARRATGPSVPRATWFAFLVLWSTQLPSLFQWRADFNGPPRVPAISLSSPIRSPGGRKGNEKNKIKKKDRESDDGVARFT